MQSLGALPAFSRIESHRRRGVSNSRQFSRVQARSHCTESFRGTFFWPRRCTSGCGGLQLRRDIQYGGA